MSISFCSTPAFTISNTNFLEVNYIGRVFIFCCTKSRFDWTYLLSGSTGSTDSTGATGPTGATGTTGPSLPFNPLAPNPTAINLPQNTNNVMIMEFFVPIEKAGDQVLLNATIGTELHVQTGSTGASSFNADAINYQLFRDNIMN